MIQITKKAIEQLHLLKKEENKPSHFLRVQTVEKGCAGYSYKMSFDDNKSDTDESFTVDTHTVVIDSKSLELIKNVVLDYDGGLSGKGFVFKDNPQATKTCGCGSSFSIAN